MLSHKMGLCLYFDCFRSKTFNVFEKKSMNYSKNCALENLLPQIVKMIIQTDSFILLKLINLNSTFNL